MSAGETESNKQEINVEIEGAKIEGDTFEVFLDIFESPAEEVRKHKYAKLFYSVLVIIGSSLFASEILSVYGGDIVAPFVPGVETQADFSYAPYGPILGVIVVTIAYPIYSHSKSLEVNPAHQSFYALADSIEHYQNREYDESFEDLEALVNSISPRSDISFHVVRYYQMEDYLEQLKAAKEQGQLIEAMKETYSTVLEPICAETILLVSGDDSARQRINSMDYVNNEHHPAVDVLINSFSQVNLPKRSKMFTIVGIGIIALVIGFTFGTQWAVLLLTLYMIYAGTGFSIE